MSERPAKPSEVIPKYEKKIKDGILPADIDLPAIYLNILTAHASWWYAERGGKPSNVAPLLIQIAHECPRPYTPSDINIRVLASRAFKEFIADRSIITDRKSIYMCPTVASELNNMESLFDLRSQYFRFGIDKLDNALGGGITTGEMLSIIGNPGSMKTSLLLGGIEQWAIESDDPVVFFSLDMNKRDIWARMMMRELNCNAHKLRELYTAQATEYKIAQQRIAKRYGGKLTVFENEAGKRWSIDELVDYVQCTAPGLVCIDFLTLLKKTKQSDFDVTNEVMPMLKELSHTWGCAVVVLSQMSLESRRIQASGGMGGAAKGGAIVEETVDAEVELFRDVPEQEGDQPRIVATIKKTRKGIAGSSYNLEYKGAQMEFTGNAKRVRKVKAAKPLFQLS